MKRKQRKAFWSGAARGFVAGNFGFAIAAVVVYALHSRYFAHQGAMPVIYTLSLVFCVMVLPLAVLGGLMYHEGYEQDRRDIEEVLELKHLEGVDLESMNSATIVYYLMEFYPNLRTVQRPQFERMVEITQAWKRRAYGGDCEDRESHP